MRQVPAGRSDCACNDIDNSAKHRSAVRYGMGRVAWPLQSMPEPHGPGTDVFIVHVYSSPRSARQHRTRGATDDVFRRRAEHESIERIPAVHAQHDEIDQPFVGGAKNLDVVRHFPQWREFVRTDAWRHFGKVGAQPRNSAVALPPYLEGTCDSILRRPAFTARTLPCCVMNFEETRGVPGGRSWRG